ncbi:hypothetical protein DFR70_102814 [Nocardia tenerifensis]|uniref:Cell wall anchor protein n=1 Tax=Nocardia tenerifensis TaxID=228006 RepID=A0A318KL21_9NOCA|nr:DUF6319 family protein [Nocardia tenerifensis]PXX69127.1 hypothetical protein DFR70_102814 [Nocardia tenerifensis]
MPSPKTKPKPLSDSEIQRIAADIAGGRPPMVWFTAAAVGVPEGRSGKVISLGDPADGDFLQVRPTGSKDVLSFSPTEVTLTKPPRGAATVSTAQPKSTTRKETPVTQPSTLTSAATPSTPSSATPPPVVPKPVASTPDSDEQDGGASKPAAKPATAAKAAKAPARPKAKTPEVTVTLTGTADGEWSVDVVSGKKRAVRGLAVPSSAVAQAAKILHPEVAEVVAGILEAAREAQEAKVQQLQAELEAARRLLDELVD